MQHISSLRPCLHTLNPDLPPWLYACAPPPRTPPPTSPLASNTNNAMVECDGDPSPGVCHRDISLENVLMDTSSSAPSKKRSCSSRSCSVSSIGSCISVASSSDYADADAEEDDAAEAGGDGSRCSSRCGFQSGDGGSSSSSNSSLDVDIDAAERRNAAAAAAADAGEEWIGTPRLCDFGMSVRIPTTETGACVCVCTCVVWVSFVVPPALPASTPRHLPFLEFV